jgi:hypothetical protein
MSVVGCNFEVRQPGPYLLHGMVCCEPLQHEATIEFGKCYIIERAQCRPGIFWYPNRKIDPLNGRAWHGAPAGAPACERRGSGAGNPLVGWPAYPRRR